AYNGLDIGETATETITYTVSDGNGGTDTAMLVISVAGANDAPVADNITLQIEQDEKVTGKVSANDADGNPLVFSGPVSGPSNGLVVVNADGSFHYVPKFGFSGSDVFVVMVDDGNGATTTAVVTIIVNPVPAFVPDVDSRYDSSSLPEQSNVLIIDGIILDAVNTIAPLGSPGVDLRVDGIVFEAVNGVSRLEQASNLHGFPGDWRGPITRMTDLARLADDALTAFPGLRGAWDIQPLTGFSVRMGVQANGPDVDPSERQQIVVDTLVHQRRVFVEISNTVNRSGSERITGYTIQQSDGQPLPVWIRRAESGLLLIETPVDQMSFAIKIVAHRADGTLIERRVEIQLPTGEVRQAEERQNRAPMFNDQLRLQRAN
ncbi:MAG: cadherin-like domain-containing protein, partial [Hyphomicrobiaceae bacterium]|nr:cadherin-like domain-containing protein [Hyphomicrobiaceae bacterium]